MDAALYRAMTEKQLMERVLNTADAIEELMICVELERRHEERDRMARMMANLSKKTG